MKVALVYHFFPHYRAAILRELLNSPTHEYLLVAGQNPIEPSIERWNIEEPARFSAAPCTQLFSSVLLQRGLLKLALRKDLGGIIYLGNAYFLSTWISAL